MRICIVFVVVAFAASSFAGDCPALAASETPVCLAEQGSNRIVTEFDAPADDPGRPEMHSPVEPGDPCDDHH